MTTKQFG